MTTRTSTDAKLISTLLLVGAALSVVANALHPFFDADSTAADIVAEASSSSLWQPIHIGVGIAVVLLTVAVVLLAGHLRNTAGRAYANVAATLAVIGGTMFTLQLTAIDGFAMPAVADLPEGESSAAAIEALGAIDAGLLSLSVMLFIGAMFVALGQALDKADAFSAWIRWTATLGGSGGLIIGLLMLLDTAADFTFIAFRIVAFATTIAAIGMAVELRKGQDVIRVPDSEAAADRTATSA